MNARPNIQLDRSLRVSDDFAHRIVDLTMKALDHDISKTLYAVDIASATNSVGNPKGQRKHFAKLVKAFGPSVLSKSLDYTGTSKRFKIRIDAWGMPEGDMHSLYVDRLTVTGLGAGRPLDIDTHNLCEITRHALVRIVQRAGFVKPEDLVALLQNAWTAIQLALFAVNGDDYMLPGPDSKGWIIPTKTVSGERVFLVAKRGDENATSRLVIVTVLDEAKIRNFSKLDALCDFLLMAEEEDKEPVYARQQELLKAFQETTASLWRA